MKYCDECPAPAVYYVQMGRFCDADMKTKTIAELEYQRPKKNMGERITNWLIFGNPERWNNGQDN